MWQNQTNTKNKTNKAQYISMENYWQSLHTLLWKKKKNPLKFHECDHVNLMTRVGGLQCMRFIAEYPEITFEWAKIYLVDIQDENCLL